MIICYLNNLPNTQWTPAGNNSGADRGIIGPGVGYPGAAIFLAVS
jgi:hypothetical protein